MMTDMKNRNTNRTLLIVFETAAVVALLALCLMSMRDGDVLVFGSFGVHSFLIFIFSLVYSSSDAFMNTDRLFIKRFALASIVADLVVCTSRTDCVFVLPLVGTYRTKILVFLILFQLVNLLGSVIFCRKYTSKSVMQYKILSSLLCILLMIPIPYSGNILHTLTSMMGLLPVCALVVGIVYGCLAQIADPGQDAAPLRNLSLLAILASESLSLAEPSILYASISSGLLFAALIWVIIVERVNARHFR